MFIGIPALIGRALAIGAMIFAIFSIAPIQPAYAQNLFEVLFGGMPQHNRAQMRYRAHGYSDPFFDHHREQRPAYRRAPSTEYSGPGPSSGFCVRTCDGRYFRVRSNAGMTATELCKSFCPAAKTQVFSGSKIEYSVAPGGQRYADLDNAFAFRERKVANCTCNGRDSLGLATIRPENDPTLRPGDIVATNSGLVTFTGNRNSKTAEFTPIENIPGSSEWKLRLMSIKVAPAPEREQVALVPVEPEKPTDRRRAQR